MTSAPPHQARDDRRGEGLPPRDMFAPPTEQHPGGPKVRRFGRGDPLSIVLIVVIVGGPGRRQPPRRGSSAASPPNRRSGTTASGCRS